MPELLFTFTQAIVLYHLPRSPRLQAQVRQREWLLKYVDLKVAHTSHRSSQSAGFYIAVVSLSSTKRATYGFVGAEGSVATDITQASLFYLLQSGQLISNGEYVSTSGLTPSEPFEVQSTAGTISTLFSILDGELNWTSNSFANQHALFCVYNSEIESIFDGQLPTGCSQVSLMVTYTSSLSASSTAGGTPTTSVPPTSQGSSTSTSTSPTSSPSAPGSVQSGSLVADPVACLISTVDNPALSGSDMTVSTVEQCLTFCSGYSYFGVQNGMLSTEQALYVRNLTNYRQ